MFASQLAAAGAYERRLAVDAEWSRRVDVADGLGGFASSHETQPGTASVRIVAPSAAERQVAAQEGAEVAASFVMVPPTPLLRGDRVTVGGVTYELLADPLKATQSPVVRAPVKSEPWDEAN